jgi:hypothetical protein
VNLNPVKARLDAAHITLALGLLYAVGFVVANAHFGRYELPRIELLRARYLAAAALFLLCSAIPFATGLFLSRSLRSRAPGGGPVERGLVLTETEAFAMGAETFWTWVLGALGFYLLIVTRFAVTVTTAPGAITLYFMAAVMASWQVCDSLVGGSASESSQAWPSAVLPQRVILVCVWSILLMSLFTVFVYPAIKPELGGGAVWKARLIWRTDADSVARSAASGIVAIVDRDQNDVAVIACSSTGAPTILSVAAADVRSIRLGERVPPASFVDNHLQQCQRFDAAPKTKAERNKQLLFMMFGLAALVALNIRNLRREARHWREIRRTKHGP